MNKIQSVIFTSVALSALGSAIILPILAPLVRELGLSESQGGWMISIGSVVMAASAAAWGIACDRFGRKFVMMAGFAGLAISFGLFTAITWLGLNAMLTGTTLFALLVAARALAGGFLTAAPSGAQALMADNTTQSERSQGMAIIAAANGAGFVLGPAMSGALALLGIVWPLVLATGLFLAAFFVVLVVVPKGVPQRKGEAPKSSVNPLAPTLFPWLLAGVLTMCSIFTIQIAGGFYFQDKLGLTPSETGPMLAVGLTIVGASIFLTQMVQVRLLRWNARTLVLAGALLWSLGVLILLYTANAASYYLAYGFLGAGGGMLMPGYIAGASLAVPVEKQGAVAGFSAAAQGIGGILAPVASTGLYEIGIALPLWGMMVLMALIVLLFAFPNAAMRRAIPTCGASTGCLGLDGDD